MRHNIAHLALPLATFLSGCYHAVGSAGSWGPDAASARVRWLEQASESFAHKASPTGTACGPASEAEVIARAAAAIRAETEADARWALAVADVPHEQSPEIRIGTSRIEDFNLEKGSIRFGLRAPFARPGTLAARRDALVQQAEADRWQGRDRERKVMRETALAAAKEVAAAARVDLLRQILAGSEAELARLQRGGAAHAVAAIDLADTEARHAQALADVASAEADLAAARARVAALAGGCGDVTADLATWSTGAEPAADGDLVGAALAARPELGERQTARFEAEAHLYEARAAQWPWLEWVQVEWDKEEVPSPEAWSFGLGISVPIFTWGGAAVSASEAELRAVDEGAGRAAARVRAEVTAAAGMVRAAKERVTNVDKLLAAIDQARLAALEQGAKAGTVDPGDVWKTKRRVLALGRQRIDALLALREAQIELAYAIGQTAP